MTDVVNAAGMYMPKIARKRCKKIPRQTVSQSVDWPSRNCQQIVIHPTSSAQRFQLNEPVETQILVEAERDRRMSDTPQAGG
jgi:hypothetical protein